MFINQLIDELDEKQKSITDYWKDQCRKLRKDTTTPITLMDNEAIRKLLKTVLETTPMANKLQVISKSLQQITVIAKSFLNLIEDAKTKKPKWIIGLLKSYNHLNFVVNHLIKIDHKGIHTLCTILGTPEIVSLGILKKSQIAHIMSQGNEAFKEPALDINSKRQVFYKTLLDVDFDDELMAKIHAVIRAIELPIISCFEFCHWPVSHAESPEIKSTSIVNALNNLQTCDCIQEVTQRLLSICNGNGEKQQVLETIGDSNALSWMNKFAKSRVEDHFKEVIESTFPNGRVSTRNIGNCSNNEILPTVSFDFLSQVALVLALRLSQIRSDSLVFFCNELDEIEMLVCQLAEYPSINALIVTTEVIVNLSRYEEELQLTTYTSESSDCNWSETVKAIASRFANSSLTEGSTNAWVRRSRAVNREESCQVAALCYCLLINIDRSNIPRQRRTMANLLDRFLANNQCQTPSPRSQRMYSIKKNGVVLHKATLTLLNLVHIFADDRISKHDLQRELSVVSVGQERRDSSNCLTSGLSKEVIYDLSREHAKLAQWPVLAQFQNGNYIKDKHELLKSEMYLNFKRYCATIRLLWDMPNCKTQAAVLNSRLVVRTISTVLAKIFAILESVFIKTDNRVEVQKKLFLKNRMVSCVQEDSKTVRIVSTSSEDMLQLSEILKGLKLEVTQPPSDSDDIPQLLKTLVMVEKQLKTDFFTENITEAGMSLNEDIELVSEKHQQMFAKPSLETPEEPKITKPVRNDFSISERDKAKSKLLNELLKDLTDFIMKIRCHSSSQYHSLLHIAQRMRQQLVELDQNGFPSDIILKKAKTEIQKMLQYERELKSSKGAFLKQQNLLQSGLGVDIDPPCEASFPNGPYHDVAEALSKTTTFKQLSHIGISEAYQQSFLRQVQIYILRLRALCHDTLENIFEIGHLIKALMALIEDNGLVELEHPLKVFEQGVLATQENHSDLDQNLLSNLCEAVIEISAKTKPVFLSARSLDLIATKEIEFSASLADLHPQVMNYLENLEKIEELKTKLPTFHGAQFSVLACLHQIGQFGIEAKSLDVSIFAMYLDCGESVEIPCLNEPTRSLLNEYNIALQKPLLQKALTLTSLFMKALNVSLKSFDEGTIMAMYSDKWHTLAYHQARTRNTQAKLAEESRKKQTANLSEFARCVNHTSNLLENCYAYFSDNSERIFDDLSSHELGSFKAMLNKFTCINVRSVFEESSLPPDALKLQRKVTTAVNFLKDMLNQLTHWATAPLHSDCDENSAN